MGQSTESLSMEVSAETKLLVFYAGKKRRRCSQGSSQFEAAYVHVYIIVIRTQLYFADSGM